MPSEQETQRLLAEIHKQLVHISGSLNVLATVARHQNPDAFKRAERHPRTQPKPESVEG